MKYYYMINGKIMSANEKMPELRIVQHKDYNQKFEDSKFKMFYNNWLNSLQPCEISESELCLILSNVTKLDYDNPIEVTDIISDNNGVITFKEKQVGEIESVAGYVAFNINGIISRIYSNLEWLKEDYPKSGYYKLSTLRNI